MTEERVAPAPSEPAPGLRQRSVRGGLWLAGRDGIGTVIRLGGVLVITSLLGPAGFGVYAGGVAVATFLAVLAQLSVEVYLVRYDGELTRPVLGTAYACLAASSTVVTALAVAVVLLGEVVGLRLPDTAVLLLLFASIPVNVLWAPAQAQLERRYAYRQLGTIELVGDLVLVGASIGLILAGFGPAGAAAGYLLWQLWLLAASHVLVRGWPVFALDVEELRRMLSFGAVMTSGSALDRAKMLVNPLLVGALLGSVAVGHIALALRVVETLSIVVRASVRLSYVTLGKSRNDPGRLRQALDEGGALVVAGLAVPLAVACVVAPVGLPLLFGPEWRESADVLSLLSVSAVVGASFILPASLLVVLGAQHLVSLAAGIRLLLLVACAALLVPALGPLGYAAADLASNLAGAVLIVSVRRRLGALPLAAIGTWTAAFAPQALTPLVPVSVRPALWLPLLLLLCVPATRQVLLRTPRMVLGVVRDRSRT